MDTDFIEAKFSEPPYSFHGPYVFYKSFKYTARTQTQTSSETLQSKTLCIGDYFFIRVPVKDKGQSDEPKYLCLMAQLQLLWINRDWPKAKILGPPEYESNHGSTSPALAIPNGGEAREDTDCPSPKTTSAGCESEESSCDNVMLPSSLTGPASAEDRTEPKKPTRGRPKKAEGSENSNGNQVTNHSGPANFNGASKKAWLKVLNLPQTTGNRYANVKIYLSPGHLVDLLSNPRIAYRYGLDEVVQLETSVSLSFKELMDGILDYNDHFARDTDAVVKFSPPINPYIDGWGEEKDPLAGGSRCCVLTYPAYLRYRAGLKKSQEMSKLFEYSEENDLDNIGLESDIERVFLKEEEPDGGIIEKVEKDNVRFLFCKTTFGDNSHNLTQSLFSTCTQAPIFRGRPKKDKELVVSKSRFRLSSLLATHSSLSTSAHMKLLKGLTNSYKAKLGYGLVRKRYDAWKCYMRRPQEPAMEDPSKEINGEDPNDSPLELDDQDELTMDLENYSPLLMQNPSLFSPPPKPEANGEIESFTSKMPIASSENGDKAREQFFNELRTFMSQRGTPIKKIPYLGFRPIDLYLFYKLVQTMGGYREVRFKRMWKRLYDHMGGCPNNTSAATCTRKHYENLLLPFEIWENRRKNHQTPPLNHDKIPNDMIESAQDSASPQLGDGPGELEQKQRKAGDGENENAIDKLFSLIMASKKNKSTSVKPQPSPLPDTNGAQTHSDGDPVKRKRGRPRLTEEEKRLRSTRLPYLTQRYNHRENDLGIGPNGLIIRKPKVFQVGQDRPQDTNGEDNGLPHSDAFLQRMSTAPFPFPFPPSFHSMPPPPLHNVPLDGAGNNNDYSLSSYMRSPAGMFPNFGPFNPFDYHPDRFSSGGWERKKKRGRPSTKSLDHTTPTTPLVPSTNLGPQSSNPDDTSERSSSNNLQAILETSRNATPTTIANGAGGLGGESVKRKRGRPPKTAEEKAATALSRKQHLAELKASASSFPLFAPPFDPSLYSSLFPFLPNPTPIPNFVRNLYDRGHVSGTDHNGTHETATTNPPSPKTSLDTEQGIASLTQIPQTQTDPSPINYSPVRQLKNPSLRRKGKVPLRITRNPIANEGETTTITDSVPVITNGWAGTRSILPRPNPEPERNGKIGSGSSGYDSALEEYKRVMEEHYKTFITLSQGQKGRTSPPQIKTAPTP